MKFARWVLSLGFLGFVSVGEALASPDIVLASGSQHTCALIRGERVKCWGDNQLGQLNVPADLVDPSQISAAGSETCVLDEGRVRCWGANVCERGRCYLKMPSDLGPATAISIGGGSGGGDHCAATDGGIRCWYVPADPAYDMFDRRITLERLGTVTQLVPYAPYAGGCAIAGGHVRCWDSESREKAAPALNHVREISRGADTICAIAQGTLHCWGDDGLGQIPHMPVSDFHGPILQVAHGYAHTCALDRDGVLCWGGYLSGEALHVPRLDRPSAISAAWGYSCAVQAGRKVRCWGQKNGRNDYDETIQL